MSATSLAMAEGTSKSTRVATRVGFWMVPSTISNFGKPGTGRCGRGMDSVLNSKYRGTNTTSTVRIMDQIQPILHLYKGTPPLNCLRKKSATINERPGRRKPESMMQNVKYFVQLYC